jgi:hypothetical protein
VPTTISRRAWQRVQTSKYVRRMAGLLACPFCRQLFPDGEARTCPECGVGLEKLEKLPPSHDALAEDALDSRPPAPEDRVLPLTYWRRGRGALLLVGLLGLATFFAPWVEKTLPDVESLSAFDLAQRRAGWLWGGAVAWFILLPLVFTRRTIAQMRGVRVICVAFAAMTLLEVLTLLLLPPQTRGRVSTQFQWGWGLYASGIASALGIALAARFGGRVDDLPAFTCRDEKARIRGDVALAAAA